MDNIANFPFPEPDLAKKIDLNKEKPPVIWRRPEDFVIQLKYDGVRALSGLNNGGQPVLVSRNDKTFESVSLNDIRDQRFSNSGSKFPDDVILDGEVYADVGPTASIEDFNELSGIVRRGAGDPRSGELYYLIFDAYFPNKPHLSYAERMALVLKYHNRSSPAIQHLYRVVTPISSTYLPVPRGSGISDQMLAALDYAIDADYEGIMLRNITLPYMAGRSGESLYKLKRFFDEEFKIVGFEEATGKDSNTPVWICTTKDGKTFKARPMGTMAAREQMWRDRKEIIGKDLTVRFQEKSRDGVPRFPVGVTIRDYE